MNERSNTDDESTDAESTGAGDENPAASVESGSSVGPPDDAAEAPGEELLAWDEREGPKAARIPGPQEAGPPPDTVDEAAPTPAETVRRDVMAQVRAYFEEGRHDEAYASAPPEAFLEDAWFDFSYLEGYEEVERTWVDEPFAYVSILYDEDDREFRYHVTEPTLDGFEGYVREDLTRTLRNSLLYRDLEAERDRSRLFDEEAKSVITDHAATVEAGTLHKLLYYLSRDFVNYAGIDPIMRDPAVEDISCDGVDIPVFVYHREYRDMKTNVSFSKRELESTTVKLAQRAGKNISISDPLVDASLPDGSRIQLTLGGEISTRGSNFTIRKFSDVPFTPVDLIEWNTFSVEEMAYFWLAIENGKSLIFAGGTGSGKTTSMNAVSMFIPPNSKVVSIEDTREMTLPHDNWIQSVTRSAITEGGRGAVDTYELLQASLRQRPEYIVVGEIRTDHRVALTFFQAIGTGHTAYTTVHADSIEGVLARLQNEPLSVPAQMLRNLDIVSIQRQIRLDDSRVRRNQTVVEILPGGENESVLTRPVFRRSPEEDVHERVGESQVLAEIREDHGWDDDRVQSELARRAEVLEYLLDNDVTDYADVTATIQTFWKDPDYVLEEMRAGRYLVGAEATDASADAGEGFQFDAETDPDDGMEGQFDAETDPDDGMEDQ